MHGFLCFMGFWLWGFVVFDVFSGYINLLPQKMLYFNLCMCYRVFGMRISLWGLSLVMGMLWKSVIR